MLTRTTSPICNTCGSKLIFVSKVTETFDGSRFPQTTSIYRCSNKECQDEKDKQTALRIKGRTEREKNMLQKKEDKTTKTTVKTPVKKKK